MGSAGLLLTNNHSWVGIIPYRLATEMQMRMLFTRHGLKTSNITVRVKAEDAVPQHTPGSQAQEAHRRRTDLPSHPVDSSQTIAAAAAHHHSAATTISLCEYSWFCSIAAL